MSGSFPTSHHNSKPHGQHVGNTGPTRRTKRSIAETFLRNERGRYLVAIGGVGKWKAKLNIALEHRADGWFSVPDTTCRSGRQEGICI